MQLNKMNVWQNTEHSPFYEKDNEKLLCLASSTGSGHDDEKDATKSPMPSAPSAATISDSPDNKNSNNNEESMVNSRASQEGYDGYVGVKADINEDVRVCDVSNIDDCANIDVDALLAKELTQMTVEERNKAYYDIHGVSTIAKEDPQKIQDALHALDTQIANIKYKPAYDKAKQLSLEYVSNKAFKLKFLRAVQFDVTAAAAKIISFFQHKMQLFGEHTLGRDITIQEDFNEYDLNCLKSGIFQVLPRADQGGRFIISLHTTIAHKFPNESIFRAYFFVFMCASHSEYNQKMGMVMLAYNIGPNRCCSFDLIKNGALLRSCLPIRTVGFHLCHDNIATRAVISLVRLAAGPHSRARFRDHYGTHQQSLASLQAFGIPPTIIPISENGEVDPESHIKWLKQFIHDKHATLLQRKSAPDKPPLPPTLDGGGNGSDNSSCNRDGDYDIVINNTDSSSSGSNGEGNKSCRGGEIFAPSPNDVLFGKGKAISAHPGNIKLHQVIDNHQRKYQNAQKFDKANIALDVVNIIKQKAGGRFLRQNKFTMAWTEVGDDEAREKVSRTFRNQWASPVSASCYDGENIKNISQSVKQRNASSNSFIIPVNNTPELHHQGGTVPANNPKGSSKRMRHN